MKYRDARRRIRLLRLCGYQRVKWLVQAGYFKEWHCRESHVREIVPWTIFEGDYNQLVRFLHLAEQRAERMLEEEIRIFEEGGI